MIQVKHFMEPSEAGDGERLWVEPVGLTRDLQEWCAVDHVVDHVGPPMKLLRWFESHADEDEAYETFRGRYHAWLDDSDFRPALVQLAAAGFEQDVTLLHAGDDPEQNTATALYEYLAELQLTAGDDA